MFKLIGPLQRWRARRQAAALHVREERIKIRDGVVRIIKRVMSSGSVSNADIASFMELEKKAKDVFGRKVIKLLFNGRKSLSAHNAFEGVGNSEERQSAFNKIKKFKSDFERLVEPYIAVRQKMPRF